MLAARYHGNKDVRIETISEPVCREGYVKVAPAFCGICGTDVHEWNGGPTFAPTPEKPDPITKESIPVGFGHEFSGVIKEIGGGVADLVIGQNVAIRPMLQCFECRACRSGYATACERTGFVGLSGGGGGLAKAVVVPEHMVFPLPTNISLEVGALVEPLAVGWHACSMSGMIPGDKILILGGGPIGLAVLQAVKARKAGAVVVAEVALARQNFARKFGADHVINPLTESTIAKTPEILGEAPDVVFECAGVPASFTAATEVVKGRGTIVNVALWEKPTQILPNNLVLKESKIIGVLGYTRQDYEHVIEALKSGAIKPEGMITKRIKLQDLVAEGIQTLLNDKGGHVKIMVIIDS